MFRSALKKATTQATQYVLPTTGIIGGLTGSMYFSQNVQQQSTRPAYAFFGFGSSSTTTTTTPEISLPPPTAQPTEFFDVVGSGTQTIPNTMAVLDSAGTNPQYFKNALTPIDRLFLKENVSNLIQDTDITLQDLRSRLEKYTEQQIKDSLSNGQSRAWVQIAIEEIKRDRLIQQHKQSPRAFKRLEQSMLHTEIIPVSKGVIDEIHICQYQANGAMEDTYCFVKDLHSTNGSVLGVFDGHSGRDSAIYCATNLVPYLDFFKYYGLSQDFMDPNVIQIADDHYLDLALGQQAYKALTGACLLLTQITNTTLNTLWAGDCRALLVRDNTSTHTGPLPQQHPLTSANVTNPPIITHSLPVDGTISGYQGDFTELTIPHQIDLNYYEKQRLVNEHPGEPDVIKHARVKGGLQPTRAFGDAHYKKMSYYRLKYPDRSSDHWFPPYITAKPDHSTYNLTSNDRYLVLSSDGLFDQLSPIEITSILHTTPSTMPATNINNLATFLTAQALYQCGKTTMSNSATLDDVSNFLPLLPLGRERRRLHDDMTVLVVKLNPQHIGNKYTDSTPIPQTTKPRVPSNLREAIKRGLLASSDDSRGGEFLTTGIMIETDPSKPQQPFNFDAQANGAWAEYKM